MIPAQFSPMIPADAKDVAAFPVGREWWYEPKLDGWRAIGQVALRGEDMAPSVYLRGRGGGDFTHKFPAVVDQLPLAMKGLSAVIDGEIVATDSEGHQSLLALQRKGSALTAELYLFDLLALNGELVISQPLKERRELLRRHFVGQPNIKLIDKYDSRKALLGVVMQSDRWEGLIAKRRNSPYRPGTRSRDWQKLKNKNYRRGA